MEKIEEALFEIRRAGEVEPENRVIDLSDMNLSSQEIQQLIPEIKKVNPTTLDLSRNNLTSLPDAIGELTSLKNLNLEYNDLTVIPDTIRNLQYLEKLELRDNKLTSLSDGISNLIMLKNLDASKNQLTDIPEKFGNLSNLENLDLSENVINNLPESIGGFNSLLNLNLSYNQLTSIPDGIEAMNNLRNLNLSNNQLTGLPEGISSMAGLTQLILDSNRLEDLPRSLASSPNLENISLFENESITDDVVVWLNSVMFGRVEFEGAADEQVSMDHTDILKQIYGEEENFQPKIDRHTSKDFRLGSDEDNKGEKVSGKEVIEGFVKDIPMGTDFDRQTYGSTAKNILDNVFNEGVSETERNTAISKMASSLGNCATPVKSLLMQELIAMSKENKVDQSEQMTTLLEREAFEEKILSTVSSEMRETEKIEQVQGLLNSVFLQGAENNTINKVKIEGERARLPSKTANVRLGFEIVTQETAKSFASLCCETDSDNTLKIQAGGSYKLDPVKYKEITEPYLAKLGIVSEIETLINKYEGEIQSFLSDNETVMENFDKPEVIEVLQTNKQKDDLRKELYKADKGGLKERYNQYLVKQKGKIKSVSEKIKEQQATQPENAFAMLTKAQPTQTALSSRTDLKTEKASIGKGSFKSQDKGAEKGKKKGAKL